MDTWDLGDGPFGEWGRQVRPSLCLQSCSGSPASLKLGLITLCRPESPAHTGSCSCWELFRSCSGVGLPVSPERLLACLVKGQQKGPVFSPHLTLGVSCLLSVWLCLAQHSFWRPASPEAC